MATLGWKYKKFPYKCRVCGESFSSKKYLKEHKESFHAPIFHFKLKIKKVI